MNIICVLLGTVIGAGFISGTEINLFFNSIGKSGIIGIIISGILLGICVFLSLESNCENYVELLNRNIKNKILIKSISFFITAFLIVSFFIMIAGLSSFILDEFNVDYIIASFIGVLSTFFIIRGNIKRIEKFNEIFIPVLITIICILAVFIDIDKINFQNIDVPKNSFAILGTVYASYNAISLIPVVIKLRKKENSRVKNKIISAIFAIITIVTGSIIFFLLESNKFVINYEIPMLAIIANEGKFIKTLVKCSIVFAILSTAISVQYAAVNNLNFNGEKSKEKFIIIIDIIAIMISKIGFKNLIALFYPLFGTIGLINYVVLVKNYIKYSKIKAKY